MYCEGTGAFGHMSYLVRACIWLVLPALSLTLRVYPLPSMGNSTQIDLIPPSFPLPWESNYC